MGRLCAEAELLRRWRISQGWSQQKAADELSKLRGWTVYRHQISNWESGKGMNRGTRASLRSAIEAANSRLATKSA